MTKICKWSWRATFSRLNLAWADQLWLPKVERPVTPKSFPPKIGPAGLILAEKPAKTGPPGPLLLPKLVWPDRFWLPKMVPFCQNQSPMGDRFWQKIICQNRSLLKVALLFLRVHGYMDAAIICSYAWLSS